MHCGYKIGTPVPEKKVACEQTQAQKKEESSERTFEDERPAAGGQSARKPELDLFLRMNVSLVGAAQEYTMLKLHLAHRKDALTEIRLPNSIRQGQTIRLRGMGLSDAAGNTGDLLIEFKKVSRA